MRFRFFLLLSIALVALGGCKSQQSGSSSSSASSQSATAAPAVDFDGNKAYDLVKQQCDFGARVPGSAAHSKCAEWLEATLNEYCDTTIVQEA